MLNWVRFETFVFRIPQNGGGFCTNFSALPAPIISSSHKSVVICCHCGRKWINRPPTGTCGKGMDGITVLTLLASELWRIWRGCCGSTTTSLATYRVSSLATTPTSTSATLWNRENRSVKFPPPALAEKATWEEVPASHPDPVAFDPVTTNPDVLLRLSWL